MKMSRPTLTNHWTIPCFFYLSQVILNTVAGVILFFTNAFVQPGGVTRNILSNGYVFAAGGLCLGAISIFWTWGCVLCMERLRTTLCGDIVMI